MAPPKHEENLVAEEETNRHCGGICYQMRTSGRRIYINQIQSKSFTNTGASRRVDIYAICFEQVLQHPRCGHYCIGFFTFSARYQNLPQLWIYGILNF